MKKIIILSALLTACLFQINPSIAQDSRSTPIVNSITQKIKASAGIKANFVMTYYDAKNVKKTSLSGQLKIKGDSYVVDMPSHRIFCNGDDVINYLVSNKEIQLSKYNKNDLLSPTQLFNAQLSTNFTYKYYSSTTLAGKKVDVIELLPKKPNKSLTSLHLYVESATKNIIGGKLFDKNGGHYYYTLSSVNMNSPISASEFNFNYKALSGVEIVDLR